MGTEYKKLNSEAERLREKEGKHEEALTGFGKALEVAETVDQKAEAMAQIGLTHWHNKNYDGARKQFEELLEFGEKENSSGTQALAHRNLSRPEITEDGSQQLEHAKKAYEFAKSSGREDLVWFAHGVVNSAFSNGFEDKAKEWLEVERREVEKLEKNLDQFKNKNDVPLIWKTGYLMDRGRINNSKEDLEEALQIAKDHNLVLRVGQIEKILEDF